MIARYSHPSPFDLTYGVFYQSGLVLLVLWASAAMAFSSDSVVRKHLANLQAGVLGFIFPAVAVRILMPEPSGILPSVMCHFALILASIWYVRGSASSPRRELVWYTVLLHRKQSSLFEGFVSGEIPDIWFVEVQDTAQGFRGYVSSLPQDLTGNLALEK